HEGDIEGDAFIFGIHATHAFTNDHGDLITKNRIVRYTVGDGRREHMTMTILMLQTFSVERRSARSATQKESAATHVTRSPGEVAHALETEHRVIDVERNQRIAVITVRGRCGHPGRHGTGFVDALLENLSLFVLAVEHHLPTVVRPVLLSFRGIDTQLPEHALHT